MTLSVRSLLLAALVALALVVAYLLGSSGSGTSAQAADQTGSTTTERVHRLTTTGTGDATAVPDEMSFAVGVTQTRSDLGAAMDAASATMDRVLAALAHHDVAKADVQTTGLSMSPVYDYHPYDPPTLTGYRVTQRASVIVRDLKQGGNAVAAAVSAGGDAARVSDLRLLVGDDDAVTARARAGAVADAKTKAQEYAEASGQTLGDVVTLSEVHTKPLPTSTYARQAVDGLRPGTAKAVPIRAGKERTSVTVRVVWELR